MNTTGWIAVITAAGTTIGALTALVIAVNKLFHSVPSHTVQPAETPVIHEPAIPAKPDNAPR